jgi:maltose alpha-D-glucosyltransferase / alpha-amylase
VFLRVDYVDGDTEMYSLPLAFAAGSEADGLRQHSPQRIIAELKLASPAQSGILYDAFGSPDFCAALLEMIWRPRRVKGSQGEIEAIRLAELRRIMGESSPPNRRGAD